MNFGGAEKIREIVYADFLEWARGTGKYANTWNGVSEYKDYSEEQLKEVFDEWFDSPSYGFIDTLNKNYGELAYNTNFELYVDDEVKVFAKDLKEYNGTTLQYIGIMPKNEDLQSFVNKVDSVRIANLIGNLKEMKRENFKDGYLTLIEGKIPKFKFEYELNLKDDLIKNGITNVFEDGKAQLTNLTDNEKVFISDAKHKANIEFTQDGIKAAAATELGGAGAGDWYDYHFEVPTEIINITFDKPYMFLIRDKETDETWFVGTVYEPLNWDEDTTKTITSW